MALVSPGIQISVTDQSQYVNANVGSVPLVVLATAQDKTYNGSAATGTSKANAGKLLAFSSQRDLVTQMGTPSFQVSSYGTPVNGSEINEYGLLAAYSALGLSNQLFAVRADIDLNQLVGTSIRPNGAPANNTLWLDTANTQWGIFEWNSTSNTFTNEAPLIITDVAQVQPNTDYTPAISQPLSSVGVIGQYALVFVDPDGTPSTIAHLFYKAGTNANDSALTNTWVLVNSTNWQKSHPAVTGSATSPTFASSTSVTINGVNATTGGSTLNVSAFADFINAMAIDGVTARAVNNQLCLYADKDATSGKIAITGTTTWATTAGIDASKQYNAPYIQWSSYSTAPAWRTSDGSSARPTGSIWWKTTTTGGGFSPVVKQYNSTSGAWQAVTVPFFGGISATINSLDHTGGGINIGNATVAEWNVVDDTTNNFRILQTVAGSVSSGTSGAHESVDSVFSPGNSFTLSYTSTGSSTYNSVTVTLGDTTAGTSLQDFVSEILAKNIPNVVASVNSNKTITITHTTNGAITLLDVSGSPVEDALFVNGQGSGFTYNTTTGAVNITTFKTVTDEIAYQASAPVAAPASGTYWYWSTPDDLDIMINDGTNWRGYRNVTNDARGYNLFETDPNGPIVTATVAPVTQSDGVTGLKDGDIWLDSGDLANFPSLYRFESGNWVAIDNTDHISSNGIIFGDARWDLTGTSDIVNGDITPISSMNYGADANYLDADAPDPALYPRGTLLFNTRRSSYNVKKYITDFFGPGVAAWVTASGNDQNGVVNGGTKAQRALVVEAMESALSSNLDLQSSVYNFNLICAPGYPELISAMVTLNSNRGNTAFVIADSPMTLAPNSVDLTNYFDNTMGDGLPQVASPYLGVYYPAGLTNDLAGNQVVVPASHAALRTFLYNDQVAYPWFAPAGTKRGLVDNLTDIGYINAETGGFVHNGINQGLRDALFTLNVNPITQLPGTGLVVFAQQTRSGTSSAQSRINVARLENYLRTIFASIANGYLFEPNDQITRKSIARQIESALNNVLSLRGLYDYLVVCDTSNNTPYTISNDQLYVDVAIEPTRDVEFIYIPIAVYNPGGIAAIGTTST